MVAPSSEPSWTRSWTTFTAGVAVASSAVTLISILGFQRFNRQRRRHELEDDIKDAMRKAKNSSDNNDVQAKSIQSLSSDSESTPRYLAALAAAQEGAESSRSGKQSNNANKTSTATMRPSINASRKSSKPHESLHYDETLIREQLSRNYSFLGEESMHKLRNSFVIVVGAGGVGSWCALMLLRSGVGRLRLIDFDQVSLSSLNRHACANLADVGRPKVQVCKEHFANIAPWCDVDARVEIFRGSEAERLLGPAKADPSRKLSQMQPTYVVDCIDNMDTKVDLLAFCYHNKIPCFSSMGAGAKADPSQIQVADLNSTSEDPLARRVRRGLRSKGIWGGGVMAKKKEDKKNEERNKAANPKKNNAVPNGKVPGKQEAGQDEDRKRKQEEALKILEAGQNGSVNRKLEHSGRGADEGQSSQKRTSTQAPSVSRRASSNSSVGSGAYFSPLSSPEEEQTEKMSQEDATIRLSDFDAEKKNRNVEDTNNDKKDTRPGLATLQPPEDKTTSSTDASSKSHRASSLNELAAVDVRNSLSGKTISKTPRLSNAGQDAEEAAKEVDRAEQMSEKPYTIMCVYTNEKSDTRLLPLDEEEFQKGSVDELAALEDFRVRILPVLGPLPAMFGLAAATFIICEISGRQLETLPWKARRKTAERTWHDLENSERKYPSPGSKLSSAEQGIGPRRIPWTADDVAYVFEEVYRCRSVVPPHETLTLGRLLRWDSTLPLSYSNVALFTREQGAVHEREVLKNGRSPVEVWGEEATRMFKRRMAEERRMNILR
jgi:tRNA threonylcarbamoyladenosine dehydratase